jgi:SAM-dependent methyltransferase
MPASDIFNLRPVPPPAMKPVSLYEFGGDERILRLAQSKLVPFFEGCAPVLDIGCGRGTFLELLAAAKIEAVGVDHSEESVKRCGEKGFKVYREDARSFLRQNPGRFGGMFCSHVIEHFVYEDALSFLELCHQTLRPGGVLLILTPNPTDLMVISELFWLDPTHVRPYPGPLLKNMVKAVGFEVVHEKQYVGHWRMIGWRNLPAYLLRRLLLGRYYGRGNTLLVARRALAERRSTQG